MANPSACPAPAALPVLPDLGPTFGALTIAVVFASFLLGILTLQVYIYFLTYPRDSRGLKATVMLAWVLDSLHSALGVVMLYHYTITNYFNPAALGLNTWSFNATTGLTAVTTGIVQGYFAYRAWRIDTKNKFFGAIIGFFALCQVGFGLGCAFLAGVHFPTLAQFSGRLPRVLVAIWLGSAALADIVITATLVIALLKARTGFSTTDRAIEKIIKFAINTGILTSIFAVVDLICYVVLDNLIHLVFNFILAKLYTNTLLATLNSRRTADGGEGLFSSTGSNRDNGATQMSKLRNMSVNGQTKPTNGRIVAVASNQKGSINVTTHTFRHEAPRDEFSSKYNRDDYDTKNGSFMAV